ncbi:helix-turn-helix transcriptional regulator [Vibrio vulnificus]|uniref:helix-turn-helix transcriptional regulator n=1 Tax=Vibrio vulnificus TaxID=672 RepID=UPI001A29F870|nr:transcriptional regulator [Vibrio vulnificus]
MFSKLIKNFRVSHKLSQSEFVAMLQESSENFQHIDTVTLSRWERGITKPHLSRQNEMLSMLGIDVFDIWNEKIDYGKFSKINTHGYLNLSSNDDLKITKISSANLHVLSEYKYEIDLIFSFEKNSILSSKSNNYLSNIDLLGMLMDKHFGELMLVSFMGQLIGHSLSFSSSIFRGSEFFDDDFLEGVPFVLVSFNVVNEYALFPTIGREIYKYLHTANAYGDFFVLVNNKRNFDFLFDLKFKYRTMAIDGVKSKIMSISGGDIKSSRMWLGIISRFKDGENV